MSRQYDLSGKVFGRLTVVGRSDRRRGTRPLWRCLCSCGNEHFTETASLVAGRVNSCGCLKSELDHTRTRTHGMSSDPLYGIWLMIRQRCLNPNNKSFRDYGGRGIKVCTRWDDFSLFKRDMGPRPVGTEIDRRDNNGDYCPDNCKWVDRQINAQNKRNNRIITCDGDSLCIAAWSRKTGLSRGTIERRLNSGWQPERIIHQPVR